MKRHGFTLIELIVVIAIISISISIGFIKFNTIDRLRANIEVQTMVNDINHAKIKGQTTSGPYKLVLEKSTYTIKPGDAFDSSTPIKRSLDYIEIITTGARNITYKPTGSVSKADTIDLKYKDSIDPNHKYKLVITVAGGHTRIEKEK